ncbi:MULTISPECIES: hypothetical protein [Pseudomonas]|uniref:hypothetical protein n=1 Tax=Pseudomonas TaxID=286 RepID=UPI001AE17BEF|nr:MULTISPECIES: hypothetical protein [unclassified Pseudomonas]MBP1127238.1 hypothetical protein [Pseudomonas sp. PvP025]MDQ0401098.1 hypothetical protein [Pseudomonas sp. PvP006]
MNQPPENAKRPISITIICVLGMLSVLISIALIFSNVTQQIGPWFAPYLGFCSVVGLACFIGLWKMKKWAVYTYTGFFLLNQTVMIAMGIWTVMTIVSPAIVIFFALKHVSKMSA